MKKLSTIDRYFYQKLGNRMNNIRLRKGISLREMSEETGLSRTALDDFFLGRVRKKDKHFGLICECLNVSPRVILDMVLNEGGG